LCINYVNEKLQHVFIERTLKLEQEEYHQENLEKIQFQSVEEIIWNEPVKKEKKETKSLAQRTKEFIDSCKTIKELKAWELMCKNNVELSQYYNEKFLTLK
jgi:hypothetical protein